MNTAKLFWTVKLETAKGYSLWSTKMNYVQVEEFFLLATGKKLHRIAYKKQKVTRKVPVHCYQNLPVTVQTRKLQITIIKNAPIKDDNFKSPIDRILNKFTVASGQTVRVLSGRRKNMGKTSDKSTGSDPGASGKHSKTGNNRWYNRGSV